MNTQNIFIDNQTNNIWKVFPIALAVLLATLLTGSLVWGAAHAGATSSSANMPPLLQPDYQSTPASATQDELNVGIISDSLSLDPALSEYNYLSWLVSAQLYDSLTFLQAGSTLAQPGLAISWTLSADSLTWTFFIRPGVKFHDGSDLDAQAVLYNLERQWDPAHPAHIGDFDYFQGLFGGYKGDPNCLIAGLTASENQLHILLTRPFSPLPILLAMPPMGIASPPAIQTGSLVTNPVGSGPYAFVEWQPGDPLQLVANPDYWGDPAHIEYLTFSFYPDIPEMLSDVEGGVIQAAETLGISEAISATLSPDLQLLWWPPATVGYLGINRAHTPLDNPLVRQAIAHAIDRDRLISDYYLAGSFPASQFIPASFFGYDPDLVNHEYDPALARDLLEQAGFTHGVTTTLAIRDVWRIYLPDPTAIATAIKAYLEAANIHASIEIYESSTFLDMHYTGEHDLFLLGWGADYPHPENFFEYHFCGVAQPAFGPRDEELCNMLAAARAANEINNQEEIYHSVGQRLHDTLPVVPLVHPRNPLILVAGIDGVDLATGDVTRYKDAYYSGAVQDNVTPEEGGTLVYTGTAGTNVAIEVPAQAVSDTVILRYTPAEAVSPPEGYGSTSLAFDLDAYLLGDLQTGFVFQAPVAITMQYSDLEVTGLLEDTLGLYYWDGSGWVDSANTCDPTEQYTRDLTGNQLEISICHLSRFALFARNQSRLFLPMVERQ